MKKSYKICLKCKKRKSINEFYKHKGMTDGYLNICKDCKKEYQKKWEVENRNKVYEYKRSNPDKIKLWKRREYLKHKDKYKERAKRRYKENKKIILKERKLYRKKNKAKIAETIKLWVDKNRNKVNNINAKRRAIIKNASGNLSYKETLKQYNLQEGKCFWCGEKLNNKYDIDHLIPLSKNGNHSCGNIVISCGHCNASKGNKLPIEFKIYKNIFGTF